MQVHVDWNLCENHGTCALVAPDVFRIDDDGQLQHESDVPDGADHLVEEAADLCPVQAIGLRRG